MAGYVDRGLLTVLLVFGLVGAVGAQEWRFYAERGESGTVILLSESGSSTKGCEGKFKASEQRFALNKWVYLRELCYELDSAGQVKLKDPAKLKFFDSFVVPSSVFKVIKNKEEREAEELARIAERNSRAIREFMRDQKEPIRQAPPDADRAPMVCHHMGSMSICD